MAEPPVTVMFKGVEYKRNPDSKHRSIRVYYRTSTGRYLHRDVWLDAHPGEVMPKGMQIHHADHNPFNNDPANLVLLTAAEHRREHPPVGAELEAATIRLRAVQPLTHAWHRTEEGREWHSRQSKEMWEKGEPQHLMTCAECGVEFLSWFKRSGRAKVDARYCSRRCLTKARDRRYLETVNCPVCGSEYQRDKYHPQRRKTCSISCSMRLRRSPEFRELYLSLGGPVKPGT